VLKYLELAEKQVSSPAVICDPWLPLKAEASIQILQPLLEKVMSVPATLAPVERVFSQSRLIVRPNDTLGLSLASTRSGLGLGLEHAGFEPIPAKLLHNSVIIRTR